MAPFKLLAALPPEEQTDAAAQHLSRATLRALQLLPELQAAWDCSTLYNLCRHQVCIPPAVFLCMLLCAAPSVCTLQQQRLTATSDCRTLKSGGMQLKA